MSTVAPPSRTMPVRTPGGLPGGLTVPGGGGGGSRFASPLPGGGGGGATPSEEPAPTAEPTYAAPGGGGGGGGGHNFVAPAPGGFQEEAPPFEEQAPTEQSASPMPSAPDPVEVVKDLWRRWREWGSPFASGPGQVRIAGEEDATRARFVATLTRPISLNDVAGMRWLFVKRLAFSAFADLSYKLTPFPLQQGVTYEFRFLARAKSNPTRDAVKHGLAEMGFLPMKLVALKRNMRLPGRQGASLTLWYGIGQWAKADSVIIADDPFAFENVAALPL